MGYAITQNDSNIKVQASKVEQLRTELSSRICDYYDIDYKLYSLYYCISRFNFDYTTEEDGSLSDFTFSSEKYTRDLDDFIKILAEFAEEESYIEFIGEDSVFIKFLIKNGKAMRIEGTVVYNESDGVFL